ncbi:protein kinase domain-containing protein [Haliangium sp.]|uniref:serine/threonine-protein kinase n=1 Tax=Haliangium sp. TaxID=2663208 RepID=UPI003D14C405
MSQHGSALPEDRTIAAVVDQPSAVSGELVAPTGTQAAVPSRDEDEVDGSTVIAADLFDVQPPVAAPPPAAPHGAMVAPPPPPAAPYAAVAVPPPAPPPAASHAAAAAPPPVPPPASADARTIVPSSVRARAAAPPAKPKPKPQRRDRDSHQAPAPFGQLTLPKPGERIGHYELIRELGRGGMGAVYLARDTKLGRRVAIKFLQSKNPEFTERFQIEARATASCSHENIVIIHEIGEHAGNPFMVLEFLQGAPLSKHIIKGQPMTPSRAVEIMVPVMRALVRAHQEEIVHRDLKPDNIFLTDTGSIKVLDFGIAKVVQQQHGSVAAQAAAHARAVAVGPVPALDDEITGDTNLTKLGALVGTMPYMSPEQWMGQGVDHRTDIWAVGVLLFKMLTGHHPLHPLRGQQLVVTAYVDQPMPRIRDKAPDVPAALAEIIDRCLLKPKEQRYASARELLDALESLLPGRGGRRLLSADRSPYAGLSAFQEDDADRFFGRSREIGALATRLRDQPLIGVVGPSGVGKSSFVRAGVVPALKQSGEAWEALVVRPGRDPLAALAAAIAPMVIPSSGAVSAVSAGSGSSSGVSSGGATGVTGTTGTTGTTGITGSSLADDVSVQQAVLQRLYGEPGFLGTVLRNRARRHGRKILLFVDQFEELYTLIPDARMRMAFTTCLAGVADDATAPLRVVVSLRSDFLDRVAEDQVFMNELSQGLFFLLPPGRNGLRDALVQPAEMAGYRFESDAVVDHMLATLQNTSGALPLLQFTASKLWEARDKERHLLTQASYNAIGGITGALATHADQVLSEMVPAAQILVRNIFLQLVTPERTRAIVSVAELLQLSQRPADVQSVLDRLVQARLIIIQTGGGGGGESMAEIVHESLIHTWPMLRRWLDENQDDAAFLDQLRTATRQWQAKGRSSGLLWRGETAEEAWRWRRRYRGELPGLQSAFLDAVFALRTRSARLRRGAVAFVMIVLAGAAAAAGVGLVMIREAQQEAVIEAQSARQAEKDARAAKEVATDKARAAQAALAAQQEAEAEARAQAQVAERARREAEAANDGLLRAAEKAKKASRRAKRARRAAQRDEAKALAAEEEARQANDELEALLAAERERRANLEAQLGSPIFEVLND